MDEKLEILFQESEEEWAEIEKLKAMRIKKDRRIISEYCANNDDADIYHILQLLEKFSGMPSHDEEMLMEFKENYPKTLTVKMIYNFEDIKDIYREYLESGGKNQ